MSEDAWNILCSPGNADRFDWNRGVPGHSGNAPASGFRNQAGDVSIPWL
jgi:hypothetical protein